MADAVAASGPTAMKGAPILLTRPNELSEDTESYLADNAASIEDIHVIGGEFAVDDDVMEDAGGTKRVSGANRWATGTAIAEEFFDHPWKATLATGLEFPDALAGGVYAALNNAPVLLSDSDELPDEVDLYLRKEESIMNVSVFGGESAVSDDVLVSITSIHRHVLNPHFLVDLVDGSVEGHGWPANTEITIEIKDDEGVIFADELTKTTDDHGHFRMELGEVEDVNVYPGYEVTITGGGYKEAHVVKALDVTEVNAEADTVSGTAEEDAEITVLVHDLHDDPNVSYEEWPRREVTAVEGEWESDFSEAVGDEPWEDEYSLENGSRGEAKITDDKGNATHFEWHLMEP